MTPEGDKRLARIIVASYPHSDLLPVNQQPESLADLETGESGDGLFDVIVQRLSGVDRTDMAVARLTDDIDAMRRTIRRISGYIMEESVHPDEHSSAAVEHFLRAVGQYRDFVAREVEDKERDSDLPEDAYTVVLEVLNMVVRDLLAVLEGVQRGFALEPTPEGWSSVNRGGGVEVVIPDEEAGTARGYFVRRIDSKEVRPVPSHIRTHLDAAEWGKRLFESDKAVLQ